MRRCLWNPLEVFEGGAADSASRWVGTPRQPVAMATGCRLWRQPTATMATIGWLRTMPPGRAVEHGVAVVEDPAVGRHQPVAAAVGRGRHPDDGLLVQAARRAVEHGVAVVEDPAVGGHQPVAAAVGVAAIPTMGSLRWRLPVEPWNTASP